MVAKFCCFYGRINVAANWREQYHVRQPARDVKIPSSSRQDAENVIFALFPVAELWDYGTLITLVCVLKAANIRYGHIFCGIYVVWFSFSAVVLSSIVAEMHNQASLEYYKCMVHFLRF